ncbi:ficolin-1-like [Physella acuta]|uniref:ficolin-1-like n=1 Tax=Physella acuta TaxID=109671 RepID=UPI0027DABA0E|nr:ficolin-1-like [Physella acuta]
MNGKVDFLRSWDEYKNGFGDFSGDFWVGNNIIHLLTVQGYRVLRFDLKFRGTSYFAEYRNFYVKSEDYKYKVNFSGYRGTAPDHFYQHENQWFSTIDRDNDNSYNDCANKRKSGWWYNDCQWVNVNGLWRSQGVRL